MPAGSGSAREVSSAGRFGVGPRFQAPSRGHFVEGRQGPLTVKGTSYSGNVMPAQEASLSPEKMAFLMTYIRGTWGNTAGAVTTDEVNCGQDQVCLAEFRME